MMHKKSKKYTVSLVGSVGIPARYGGFETFAENLVYNTDSVFNWVVYCSKSTYKKQIISSIFNNTRLRYSSFSANGWQSLFYDSISILKSLRNSDLIFVLGVSGAFIFPFVKLFSSVPIVLNPDGLEWRRRNNRSLWWHTLSFLYRIGIKYADYVVCDNELTARFVSRLFKRETIVIGYGGDTKSIIRSESKVECYFDIPNNYDLTIARIVPENNIHIILEAYSKISNRNIVVIGNFENSSYGRDLKHLFKEYSNIFLISSIYDVEELNRIRDNANLYIHAHSCGGTNPSLVEAMYHKKCIVAYDVLFNKIVTNYRALYFKSADDLISLILNVNEEQIGEVEKAMFSISEEKYTWKKISDQYTLFFNKILQES